MLKRFGGGVIKKRKDPSIFEIVESCLKSGNPNQALDIYPEYTHKKKMNQAIQGGYITEDFKVTEKGMEFYSLIHR